MKQIIKGGISVAKIRDGNDGKGISSSVTYYAQVPEGSTSVPSSEWRYKNTPPAHADGWVIWMKQIVTYSDNTTSTIGPTQIEGAKGSGVTISSISVTYATTTSPTKPADSAFTATTMPTPTAGRYIWSKTVITYSDGKSTTTYAVTRVGADGRSVTSIKEQYYLSTSSFELAGGEWADTPQAYVEGDFYWTRSVITYSDGTSTTSDPVCVSGTSGAAGKGISSVDVEYYQSTSATELAGGKWQTTAPTWASGKYVWTRTKTTYTDGTSDTTDAVCLTGEKGQAGDDGRSITDTITYYAEGPSYETAPTSGWQTKMPTHTKWYYTWSYQRINYSDGTHDDSSPVCLTVINSDYKYLADVIHDGETTIQGGLLLTNILGLKGESGDVRSYMSGLQSGRPAIGLGVKKFGLDGEYAVTEFNHDGSGHVGPLYFTTVTENDAQVAGEAVGYMDSRGDMRIMMTTGTVPTKARMSEGNQNASTTYSVTIKASSLTASGVTATSSTSRVVSYNNTRLTIVVDIAALVSAVEDTDWATFEVVLLKDGAEYAVLCRYGNIGGPLSIDTTTYKVYPTVAAGTYKIQVNASRSGSSTMDGSIEVFGTMAAYRSNSKTCSAIGQNGATFYNSSTNWCEIGNNYSDEYAVRASGIMTDNLMIGSGLGLGILWAGYVGSAGTISRQWGVGVTSSNKGRCVRTGTGRYTVTLPNGLVTNSNYAVMTQSYMESDDNRYCLVYSKSSSKFYVQAYTGNNYNDCQFFFIVFSMDGWI